MTSNNFQQYIGGNGRNQIKNRGTKASALECIIKSLTLESLVKGNMAIFCVGLFRSYAIEECVV